MGIRDFCIVMLSFCCTILAIGHYMQEVKIANFEQSLKRIEQGYNAALAENQKMERMNDQLLQLMAEGSWPERGGWDGIISDGTSD